MDKLEQDLQPLIWQVDGLAVVATPDRLSRRYCHHVAITGGVYHDTPAGYVKRRADGQWVIFDDAKGEDYGLHATLHDAVCACARAYVHFNESVGMGSPNHLLNSPGDAY